MRNWLVPGMLLFVTAEGLASQVTIPGADKENIAILSGGPSLNLDVTQAKLGLTLLKEFVCAGRTGSARENCLADVNRNHIDLSGRLGAAAQDGKRTLFATGGVTPGLELGGSLSFNWERSNGGYVALYMPVLGRLSQVKTAIFQGAAATLSDGSTKSLGLGLGIVYAVTESRVLGVSVNIERDWDSPSIRKPQQVCAVTNTGTDSAGNLVNASECEDRIIGPLVDETIIQPRLEALLHLPKGSGTSFGIVASVSGTKRTALNMSYSAAIGPTLHPSGHPGQVLAAVLFAFSDFTDANNRQLKFKDIFSTKLYLAVPLSGF